MRYTLYKDMYQELDGRIVGYIVDNQNVTKSCFWWPGCNMYDFCGLNQTTYKSTQLRIHRNIADAPVHYLDDHLVRNLGDFETEEHCFEWMMEHYFEDFL